VLVLDNLHEVTSPEVHAGLLRLVERRLAELSLLVTTRHDLPWPLERLRLAGLLTGVRASDLAFRSEETAALFGNLNLDLDEAQLERLVERTEGWAAGLHLTRSACSAVRTCRPRSRPSPATTTVWRAIFSVRCLTQSPELVTFLEQISVVDLVSAELADALTGRNDGAAMLAELAASHVFMQAVGTPGRWYRLH
jgi:LuxR family maltose regulon positive regulatory protein